MAVNNTITETSGQIYKEEFAIALQERLNKPENWKEIADVIISDTRDVNIPYMSSEYDATSHTRGTAYSLDYFTLTGEQLSISSSYITAPFVDRADLAQITFINQVELAYRNGKLLSGVIETAMLSDHANWTDAGDSGGVLTSGETTKLTVSESNIDTIVTGLRSILLAANGKDLLDRNGMFICWRAADWKFVETFAMANGYNVADRALREGTQPGVYMMGCWHYVSNSHTAGHIMGGVRKIQKIGILRSTYGQLVVNQDPADTTPLSGISFVNRIDYGVKTPTGLKTLVYDINVN